uniref:Olfactory receptor n=1 Tax=Sphenodon punctatus TaxID=8508 RepID=A0A8D0GMP0_SPHPU
MNNATKVTEFILLGLTDIRWLQILLFVVLLITYLFTLIGNLIIIIITLVDHHLQTPMYFFLRNFSFLEISFTSIVVPKMLSNLLEGRKTISRVTCFAQFFFYFVVGITELFILAVMSIDRYVAICHPLRYPTIMNRRVCIHLVAWSWIWGVLFILFPTIVVSKLPFCGPNVINHFFCDNSPLIKLSCSDTQLLELLDFLMAFCTVLGTLAITIVSYVNIISTVLRIPSTTGRQKAFSTCASHIIVVSITYGSCIFLYVKPTRSSGVDFNKTAAIFNNIVCPFLNPFIYSLRNKQVQEALKQLICDAASSWFILHS